jgi:hypothetical protein
MNGRHALTGGAFNRLTRGGAASATRPLASAPSAPGRTVLGRARRTALSSGADGFPDGLQGSGVRTRSTAGRRELRLPARRPARLVRGRTPEDVRGTNRRVAGREPSASRPGLVRPPNWWAACLTLPARLGAEGLEFQRPTGGRVRPTRSCHAERDRWAHGLAPELLGLASNRGRSAQPRPTTLVEPAGRMAGFESSPLCLN